MPIPHAHPDRAARIADRVLGHPIAQRFSWRTTEALLAISRHDPGIDPDVADRLAHQALAAVVTAEILAGREARP